MNGFLLIVEISGLQQFLKIDEENVKKLIENCERSINNTIQSKVEISGSFIVFTIFSDIGNAPAVCESAETVLEIVASFSEDIHEYSMMLLFRDNIKTDEDVEKLRQRYFSDCIDSALLIEDQLSKYAGIQASESPVSGFKMIRHEPDSESEAIDPELEKMISPERVKDLVELVIPELGQTQRPVRIMLSGQSELELQLNTDAALRMISGDSQADWIEVKVLEGETEYTMPFYRSVEPGFIDKADEYLTGIELKTWKMVKHRFKAINSDYPEESFFVFYSLYLKARITELKSKLLPAVIILKGIENSTEGFLDYFEKILGYISPDDEPVIFIFNSGEDIGEASKKHELLRESVNFKCGSSISDDVEPLKLRYFLKKLLFITSLTEGIFENKTLEEFLKESGYTEAEIDSGLGELEKYGFIRRCRFIQVINNAVLKELPSEIKDKKHVYQALGVFISGNIYNSVIADYGLAAERLLPEADDELVGYTVYSCLSRLLDYQKTAYVKELLVRFAGMPEKLLKAAELRCLLIAGDRQSCLAYLEGLPENPVSPDNLKEAVYLLAAAGCFHALNNYQRALNYVKKVLIYLQNENYSRLEGVAFIELGAVMLCKGKMLEASEYLSLSIERLINSGDSFNLMKAYFFSSLRHYLWGSFDQALEQIDLAVSEAETGGYENWFFYTAFFRCRLYFELGRYNDAEKMLADCLLRNECYRDDDRYKLFSAWAARACVFQGKVYRGINMLKTLRQDPEVLMFSAEGLYFKRDLKKAAECLEDIEEKSDYFELSLNSTENISWENGFTAFEERILRTEEGSGILLHNIKSLHALFAGLSGNREYGIEILYSLTRDQKISENDPFNRIYFYFYSLLIDSRKDPDMVDKLTLMSKALKYLQQTSSRINVPGIRQEYMNKNYWNSQLAEEARREKLL